MPTQTWLSKNLFVLIITLSKEKKMKQTKKIRLLVFTRKVNVRAHPSVHSFLFQGSENMIQHDWTSMVRHQQSAYLRQVSTCLFFLILSLSAETSFGTSSTIISQDWEGLTNQTRPQVPFFNESCFDFLFRGCFFRQHTASAKKLWADIMFSSLDKIFLLWIAIPCEVEYGTRLRIPGFKQHGVPSI